MGRKHLFIVSGMMAAVCSFTACGKGADEIGTAQIQMQPDESQKEDAANEKEGNQMDSTANDLTGQNVRKEADIKNKIEIDDYSIESYKNIQLFGYDLLAQNMQEKNPVLSPVSAYLALAMAGCGADGVTKEEFCKVLGGTEEDVVTLSYNMIDTLPAKGDVLNLSIADSAWIDDELTVDGTWLDTIQSLLDAEAYQADLSTGETMDRINHWINDKTNGLINQMLAEPLDVRTRLALFNTVYFKGKWEIPFAAADTRKEDFYLQNDRSEKKQVDMMNLYMTDLDYIANDFVEGIILPYQKNDGGNSGANLAFVALKPIEKANIRDAYSKLTEKIMTDILVNRQTWLVNLKLPKFEITFDRNLNESLTNMGLVECFDAGKANFDRIGKTHSGDNLYISLVRQKAKIIVDEEGTEAAAVTEILMAGGAAMVEPEEPREVYFDEPFLYMIMDLDKEIPLFIGIMDDPVS